MTDANKLTSLKNKLGAMLEDPATDFQAIAEIAAEIAKQEPGVVRFTTDAAMVRRLGRELVAKQETALAELVKNAYDADATVCAVSFDDAGKGSLQLVDDGTGMTRTEIVNGFMRLASDSKVNAPISPKYSRPRAGKKGIGRFATERLGRHLTIITQTESDELALTVNIDWNAFTQGSDINLVKNSITQSPKERPHGTRLYIKGLNDKWNDSDLLRVYRYVSTLLQPVDDSRSRVTKRSDPGFNIRIMRGTRNIADSEPLLGVDATIYSRAVAVIDGKIDNHGNASWWFSTSKLNLSSDHYSISLDQNKPQPVPNARNVELKAFYFIQLPEFLGHSAIAVKKALDEHGGIRVYRNGYRVPPYGELHDDWLGLDYKRSRTWAPISSKTFLGYVALFDTSGVLFEETSSREGLIDTAAFQEVRSVVAMMLEAAVLRIESVRGKGRRPKKTEIGSGQAAAQEVENAVAEIEALVSSAGVAGSIGINERQRLQLSVARVKEAARTTAEIVRERDDLLKELNLLRILASMGLTIAEFTHDFSHLAETMELNVQAIKRAAAESPDALDQTLSRFEDQFRRMRGYIAHFGNMMTSNASRHLQAIDLYAFALTFRDDMNALFSRRGMDMTVERPSEYDLLTTRMHPSEWSSILLNLMTNSIKATKRAQRAGRFLIRLGRSSPGFVFLEFSDNGDGIPFENRERIFDAFFTTTGGSAPRASDATQAIGTGLGLKIVADIAHSVGGRAEVVDAPAGYSTAIRITVPAGSTENERESES